ncbi:MAG: hypothetical protein COB67_12985 [SAR324 cluster bacterium]|uniref:Dehydrogenase n=1 Tax=SAR324 cluster bacterium TaxID=2024889 RepID=A0A2A4SQP4_9DELT|nr:MAG: hypothetical protein COB67_12985 [SAR324 cluster bacterium]
MQKKICLITGANSGIGKASAVQIAEKGFHVIIACRNPSKGQKALQEIRHKSKSDSIELMHVDMSLQSSVKDLAMNINEKYGVLDVIIQNAAIFDITQKEIAYTEEKIESIWATNHLGPVLLTELLLSALKRSPQGRIITIASKGLVAMPFLQVNLQDPEFQARTFNVTKAYYQSKMAQLMYTYWLSEQLKGTKVTANCIRVPSVKVDLNKYPDLSKIAKSLYSLKMKFALSPEDMGRTYAALAASEEVGEITGKYFDEHSSLVKSSKYSIDFNNIERVMDLTMGYIKQRA